MTVSPDEPVGLWISIAELATRKSVSRQSAHERVGRLKKEGLITVRPGKGRSVLINLAEYDRAIGEVADLGRELGAATKRGGQDLADSDRLSTDPTYTREQARNMSYRADMAKLELDERTGRLLRKDEVVEAVLVATGTFVQAVDRLPYYAEDLAAAVGRDGPHGARIILKKIAVEIRDQIARDLKAVADAAPEVDPLRHDDAPATQAAL